MTQREIEQVRAQLDALRDGLLSSVKQVTTIMASLPSEPPPPPKPADSLDGISFASGNK